MFVLIAAIRPFLMSEEEQANAPKGIKKITGNGPFKAYSFTVQVAVMDCTGCGNCVDICPAKSQAIIMKPLETQLHEQSNFDYLNSVVGYKDTIQPKTQNVKNLMFSQPLFEFSGACAGCGETPYLKTISQLFGDRMMLQMQQVAHQYTVALSLLHHIPQTRMDMVHPGQILCLKIMLNLA
jgi:pyruvate-ferredoxin/flavodoxin oxidoreductase